MMKKKFLDAYMDVAFRFSELSTAVRLKVGAIIVKDDRIISIGYNGTPPRWSNECENKEYMDVDAGGWLNPDEVKDRWPFYDGLRRYRLVTKDEVIHAEANAIAKLAKSHETGVDSKMFLTHAPCLHCAKQIYTAGIDTVYYRQNYRDTTGLDFLKKCNVKVEQI